MSNYAISLKRTGLLLAAMTFTALLMVVNFASFFSSASAAQLTNRSLTLSSTMPGTYPGDGVGGSATNGSDATWTFEFDVTGATADLVEFEICDDPISAVCTAPTGVNTASVANGTGGVAGTAATVDANHFSFTPSAAITGPTADVTIVVDNMVNPNEVEAFFVRIVTSNGGTDVDDGVVASAITEGIEITARVKETLGFSTGGVPTGGVVAAGGTCAPITTDGAISLGDPVENALDVATSYINYSAFRIYTNAATGVSVQYEGETLTRGGGVYNPANDMIDEMTGTAQASAAGSEQFGLAIDGTIGGNNSAVVNSVTGTVDFTNFDTETVWTGAAGELTVDAEYSDGDGDMYAFVASQANATAPETIASSTSYVDCVTVPVKYVANISPLTPAGTYTTTVVYSAVPTY